MSFNNSLSDSSSYEPSTPIRAKRKHRGQWIPSSDEENSNESIVRIPRTSHRLRVDSSSDSSGSSVAGPSKKKLCRAVVESENSDTSSSSESDIVPQPWRKEVSGRKKMFLSDSDFTDSENEKPNSSQVSQKDEENFSSDSDGAERCIICFKTLRSTIAQPSNCNHTFHSECLLTWSKTSNTCPIDRVKYTEILIRGINGKILSKENVTTPPPQDHNSYLEPDDPTFCEVCNQHDRENEMLLCDRCEAGYHLDCLTPALSEVPSGDWFCPDCSSLQNDIDEDEINELLQDGVVLETRLRRRLQQPPRIQPRTRAAQRVLNTIRHRANQQPSTSSGKTRNVTKKKSRRKGGTRYKVEFVTTEDGTTVEVKLAIHTGKCKRKGRKTKRRSRSNRISIESSDKCRYLSRAGVKESKRYAASNSTPGPSHSLDLFGTRPQLDYFSGCEAEDELEEDGGLAVLRAGRTVVRGMAERKQIAAQILASRPRRVLPSIMHAPASNDVLSSILQEQEKMYSFHPQTNNPNSSSPNSKKRILPSHSEGLPVRKAPGSNSNHSETNGTSQSLNLGNNSQYNTSSTGYHSAPPLQPPPQPPFSRLYDDEDIDLYADIEPPTCRLTSSLAPPPEPPALLLAIEDDGGSSPDEGTMLVIDDQREVYDPEEPTSPSPDKPKEDNGTNFKCTTGTEDVNVYPKININLEDIQLPSPIEIDNDSECPNTVMYSKMSRSIARRGSTESTVPSQGELENGVSKSCSVKISSRDMDPSIELNVNEENYPKQNENEEDLKHEEEIEEEIAERSNITNENADKNETDIVDESPAEFPVTIDKINYTAKEESQLNSNEELITTNDELTNVNETLEKPFSDSEGERTVSEDNEMKDLAESKSGDLSARENEDEKQDSLEKIDLMEESSLGDESENFNESQNSGDNMEADDDNKSKSPDREKNDEKESEDVLVLGCEEGDRDGLVDITDEEMSTYEKNWEMENDGTKNEKRVGLEGLETEAISECEDTLYDDVPVKPIAENSTGKEEGEIVVEEKVESIAWKKISKGTKERNYREKEVKEKNKENKKKEKKTKEKRKEMERYDVRKIISDKPKKRKTDEFGRDISNSRSRSTSKVSDSRGKRKKSRDRRKSRSRGRSKSRSRGRSRSKSRARSASRVRGRSRGKSASPVKARPRGRSWSRSRGRSRGRSRDRSRSRSKRRLRSRSLRREKPRERIKSKERKRRRKSTSSCSSCSCSSCERERRGTKKLTVIVPNKKTAGVKKSKTKKKDKGKDKNRKDSKRRKADSPVPSKEVFTSGDNILVSVNFKSSKSGEVNRTKDGSKKKRDEESRRKKDKSSKENQPMRSIVTTTVSVPPNMPRPKRKNKLNVRNMKPVAIIDLDQSPFREQTPSPKEVIILSDSDNEEKGQMDVPTIQSITTGPKTPPEPHIKFSISVNKPQIRNLTNPLLDTAEPEEREGDEEEQQEMSHKGPNTPPEPPVPYDPFEPTKSRSPTPRPDADDPRIPSPPQELNMCINRSPEQPKMSSPPKLALHHDSPKTPSPLQSPPKPQEDISQDKPKPPVYTPAMTTNCSDDGGDVGGGDSPYSPGSSEGDDLFEPPIPQMTSQTPVAKVKPRPIVPQKHTNTLKLTPSPLKKRPLNSKGVSLKSKGSGNKKEIAIKLDEDQLKILDELPNSAVEMQVKDKFLKKLNRQERVVEEVKLVLKPHYAKKHVTKEEYKDILRKSVPKICHNRSGEINPIKIQHLIEAYVKKYRHKKKKGMMSAALLMKPKQKQSMWC